MVTVNHPLWNNGLLLFLVSLVLVKIVTKRKRVVPIRRYPIFGNVSLIGQALYKILVTESDFEWRKVSKMLP